MRSRCLHYDQLWAEYQSALSRYIEAVDKSTRMDFGALWWSNIAPSRSALEDCRKAVQEHCRTHDCDQPFMKAPAISN
jgi:hypothetical protein